MKTNNNCCLLPVIIITILLLYYFIRKIQQTNYSNRYNTVHSLSTKCKTQLRDIVREYSQGTADIASVLVLIKAWHNSSLTWLCHESRPEPKRQDRPWCPSAVNVLPQTQTCELTIGALRCRPTTMCRPQQVHKNTSTSCRVIASAPVSSTTASVLLSFLPTRCPGAVLLKWACPAGWQSMNLSQAVRHPAPWTKFWTPLCVRPPRTLNVLSPVLAVKLCPWDWWSPWAQFMRYHQSPRRPAGSRERDKSTVNQVAL